MALYNPISINDVDRVKFLIESGEDVNSDWGPLGIAIAFSKRFGNTTQIVELLIEGGLDVHMTYDRAYIPSPFIYACLHGCVDICQLLIRNGVDVFQRDGAGHTALHVVLSAIEDSNNIYAWDTPRRLVLMENRRLVVQVLEKEMDRIYEVYNTERNLVLAMGNHFRIGELSRLSNLDPGVIEMISRYSSEHRS